MIIEPEIGFRLRAHAPRPEGGRIVLAITTEDGMDATVEIVRPLTMPSALGGASAETLRRARDVEASFRRFLDAAVRKGCRIAMSSYTKVDVSDDAGWVFWPRASLQGPVRRHRPQQ